MVCISVACSFLSFLLLFLYSCRIHEKIFWESLFELIVLSLSFMFMSSSQIKHYVFLNNLFQEKMEISIRSTYAFLSQETLYQFVTKIVQIFALYCANFWPNQFEIWNAFFLLCFIFSSYDMGHYGIFSHFFPFHLQNGEALSRYAFHIRFNDLYLHHNHNCSTFSSIACM